MMAKAVRITGHKEARKRIRGILDEMDQQAARGELKNMNQEAAQIVADRAVGLVPVQTGTLRDTIRAAGAQKSGRVRAGFKRVPYAGPIHFGWAARNIDPNPFLYDALDQRRREVLQHYDQQLEALIKKYDLD
jgi:hypothetical protein